MSGYTVLDIINNVGVEGIMLGASILNRVSFQAMVQLRSSAFSPADGGNECKVCHNSDEWKKQ